jgi:hypothetical protein
MASTDHHEPRPSGFLAIPETCLPGEGIFSAFRFAAPSGKGRWSRLRRPRRTGRRPHASAWAAGMGAEASGPGGAALNK